MCEWALICRYRSTHTLFLSLCNIFAVDWKKRRSCHLCLKYTLNTLDVTGQTIGVDFDTFNLYKQKSIRHRAQKVFVSLSLSSKGSDYSRSLDLSHCCGSPAGRAVLIFVRRCWSQLLPVCGCRGSHLMCTFHLREPSLRETISSPSWSFWTHQVGAAELIWAEQVTRGRRGEVCVWVHALQRLLCQYIW